MTISVFVEPTPKGFRATTGSPLELTAEAKTEDAAIAAVRAKFAARLQAGGKVHQLHITDVDGILEAVERLRNNPMFEEVEESIRQYRRKHNTKPSRR